MHVVSIAQQFLTRNSNALRELRRDGEIYNVEQPSTDIAFASYSNFHIKYLEAIYSFVVIETLLTYTYDFNYSLSC